jgi:putative flippase GtrA
MQRIVRFVFAGGVGFVADAAALWLLLSVTPLGPLVARILSIGFALSVTWLLNRQLTFSPSSRGIAQEGVRYGSVGIATSIVNYLVYSAILLALPAALGYSRLVFDR